jgi:hypothetical protein
MTRKAGDAIIYWKILLLLLRLLQDMTKLLRFFPALFAADHMLLLCEGVSIEMPVVVVMMIEFFFLLSEREGTEERKKERKTLRLSASFFLSFFLSWGSSCNHRQQQPPFAHSQNARCPAHKYERERETYCKLLPTVPKQQLEFN